ncbi:Major exported protein [compost metagenome]
MPNYGYMTITGKTQGLISVDCSIPATADSNFPDKIRLLSYSHTLAKMDDTQQDTYHQIHITKNIDKSSHLLARALTTGEEINCTIDFYRAPTAAPGELIYAAEIYDGIVWDMTIDFPHADLDQNQVPQELLTIRYRHITWSQYLAGSGKYTSWRDHSERDS